ARRSHICRKDWVPESAACPDASPALIDYVHYLLLCVVCTCLRCMRLSASDGRSSRHSQGSLFWRVALLCICLCAASPRGHSRSLTESARLVRPSSAYPGGSVSAACGLPHWARPWKHARHRATLHRE